jgi:hypothetical protein
MQISNLTPGTQIKLYKKVRGGFKSTGIYTVVQVTNAMIVLKKDIGYTKSVSVLDLRQRLARIFLVDGTEVKFASLPDIKKLDEEHRNKVNEEYESMFREEREFMAVITREAVKKMFDEGKSVDEIVAEFKPSYPNARESILKAKVSLYINGKQAKESAKKKEVEPAPAAEEEKIVAEKQKEEAMQKCLDRAATKTSRKIRYYISTGYDYKDRAEKLANIIKAAGGEITVEWWKYGATNAEDLLAELSEYEFKGIESCDVFVCMLPGYYGTHTELGAAVILKKKIILHAIEPEGFGSNQPPCYYAWNVKRIIGSELDLVAEVLKLRESC